MKIKEIISKFDEEFGPIADRFSILEENCKGLIESKTEFIYHPGVYVFVYDNQVIKVGRHLTNSRKRAYEHIIDNTHNESFQMKDLINYTDSKVLLFNLKKIEDNHWAASLEIFFEKVLNPRIRSKRH